MLRVLAAHPAASPPPSIYATEVTYVGPTAKDVIRIASVLMGGRRLPDRAAALARAGRRHRQVLRNVGADQAL